MVEDTNRTTTIFCILGAILTIWIALLIAPYIDDGLVGILNNLESITNNFYNISFCKNSLNTVLFFMLFYGMGLALYFSTRKNYRKREEHGSAKWGSARVIRNIKIKKYLKINY